MGMNVRIYSARKPLFYRDKKNLDFEIYHEFFSKISKIEQSAKILAVLSSFDNKFYIF